MKLKSLNAVHMALLLSACGLGGNTDFVPPVDALAKVVTITVGTNQLYLPVVAVSWAGRSRVARPCPERGSQWLCSVPLETLAASSGTKGTPISATSLNIRLGDYSIFKNTALDKWFDIPQLCEMLTQEWARQQCLGPSLFKDNLQDFVLIEVTSLAKVNSLSVIGGQKETVSQVVQRMRFVGDEPNIDCASEGQGLCTAAMRIADEVLAVWIVSNSDIHSIRKQAAAIRAFLKNAAGQEENYPELKAALSRAT